MIKNYEQQLIEKINTAKAATQKKLFNQFIKAKEDNERNEIGAKMNVLDSVIFDLIKQVRGGIE